MMLYSLYNKIENNKFNNPILEAIHESNKPNEALTLKPIYRIIVVLQSLCLLITKRHRTAENECYAFRCYNRKMSKDDHSATQFLFLSLFRMSCCKLLILSVGL